MDHKDIIPVESERETANAEEVKTDLGHVLNVSEDTEGIDFGDILNKLLQYANIAISLENIERTTEYVVQIPVKYQKAFEAGQLYLNQKKATGEFLPTLYKLLDNGKREIVCNLPIKQQEFVHGNPIENIAISFHNLAIQQQLSELSDLVHETLNAVERVEQGQMDDRIGHLKAGYHLIVDAMNANEEERKNGIERGRQEIIIAQQQFLQSLISSVSRFEPLPKSRMKQFQTELLHQGTLRRKDKEFNRIQTYFELYLLATKLIAESYIVCGQTEQAERELQRAEMEMEGIDFSAVKTLKYIHPDDSDMLYYHAADYIAAEREDILSVAQEYDTISLKISGAKLLEVLENG